MQFRGPTGVSLLSALLLSVSCSAWPFFDYFQQSNTALLPPSPPQHHSVRSFGPHEPQKPITLRSRVDVVDNTVHNLSPRSFRIRNVETGLKVANWHKGMGMNPEELGVYMEGDIVYPKAMRRSGINFEDARWPSGIVPYTINSRLSPSVRKLIEHVMAYFSKYTCIRFTEWKGEQDYIHITAYKTGCWSSIGRVGGRQDVNLQVPICIYKKGTIIHELMHAIGFLHEQNRPDRDQYVDVFWRNVEKGKKYNFEKSQWGSTSSFSFAYDYNSVMHYSIYAFSHNGYPTILPKDKLTRKIGQRKGFSIQDIQKIQAMYNCPKED